MAQWQERAELLFKSEGIAKLEQANVLIVGLGGVGSFAAEFIARAGVGKMTIVDGDVIDITNAFYRGIAQSRTNGCPFARHQSRIKTQHFARVYLTRTRF